MRHYYLFLFFSTLFIIKINNDCTKLFPPFLVPSPSMIIQPSLPPILPKRSPGKLPKQYTALYLCRRISESYIRTSDERDVVRGPVRRGAHVSCTSRTPLQLCAYERTLLPHLPRALTHSLIHASTPVVVVVCGAQYLTFRPDSSRTVSVVGNRSISISGTVSATQGARS